MSVCFAEFSCFVEFASLLPHPQWGIADVEMKTPSVENPELSKLFPFGACTRSKDSHVCFAYCQEGGGVWEGGGEGGWGGGHSDSR